ncbi:MAG: RluA family pseudouridine synthase [Anaerolineae bacterium]|nr:MAG: RluA family pseudouridine synthase [Anaerolineae bacterium]
MSERAFRFEFTQTTPQRLDRFLASRLTDISRSRIKALILGGLVTVDGEVPPKAGVLLNQGAQVEVTIPPAAPSRIIPQPIPLDILYEDDNVLVINKPAGMVVHPAAGHASDTLVNAVLAHAPGIEGVGGEKRPGIVHRLDKDTSGVMILAKNDAAQHWLAAQFHDRQVEKRYLALVDGRPPTPEGRVEAPIGRDPRHRQRMAILPPGKGRMAISEYFTRRQFERHTLLEVRILTGRTHQIRLHMKMLGCPVAGDRIYGRKTPTLPLERQFLHAWRLALILPGETRPRTFETPLPDELQAILNLLGD